MTSIPINLSVDSTVPYFQQIHNLEKAQAKCQALLAESRETADSLFNKKQAICSSLKALDPYLVGEQRTQSSFKIVKVAYDIFYSLKVVFSKIFGDFDVIKTQFEELAREESRAKAVIYSIESQLLPDIKKNIGQYKAKIDEVIRLEEELKKKSLVVLEEQKPDIQELLQSGEDEPTSFLGRAWQVVHNLLSYSSG